ncbi:MAG: AzlC family ABC transporter permease [Pseudomonadota bacterium]
MTNPAGQPRDYGSPNAAFLGGLRDTVGAPGLVLGATYVGFGSLVRVSEWPLWLGIVNSITGWAIPGQIALVELFASGAPIIAIIIAVWLTNMRLLPMTLALMPMMLAPGIPRWRYYVAAHVIAVTGWVQAMRECPLLPLDQRLPYFSGFAGTLFVMTIGATALGYHIAGAVPPAITLGLVFLNPIYFMLVFAADARSRARILALVLGAVGGPVFHILSPTWGLMLTGLIAGSIAFWGDRLWPVKQAPAS